MASATKVNTGTKLGFFSAFPLKGGSTPIVKTFLIDDEKITAVSAIREGSEGKKNPRRVFVRTDTPHEIVVIDRKNMNMNLKGQTKTTSSVEKKHKVVFQFDSLESMNTFLKGVSAKQRKEWGVSKLGIMGQGGKIRE